MCAVVRMCPDYCGCLYSPAMLQVAILFQGVLHNKIAMYSLHNLGVLQHPLYPLSYPPDVLAT